MPTLYVENVPEDLYQALREQARANQSSIAAEVISLLRSNVPTSKEVARRQEVLKRILGIQRRRTGSERGFPSAEQMQREDRLR